MTAYSVKTIEDPNAYVGTTTIEQKGSYGEQQQTLKVTYINGKPAATQLMGAKVIKQSQPEIIEVGTKKKPEPKKAEPKKEESQPKAQTSEPAQKPQQKSQPAQKPAPTQSQSQQAQSTSSPSSPKASAPQSASTSSSSSNSSSSSATPATPAQTPQPAQSTSSASSQSSSSSQVAPASSSSELSGELSPAEAQTFAAGVAEDQYGWDSTQFSCLVELWNRESGWMWDAENVYSGAYGIAQVLPPSKMGTGWEYNAKV